MEASGLNRVSTTLLTWFSKFIIPSFQAIREGMVWLIPCLMISSFCLLLACLGEFILGYRTAWVSALYDLHDGIALFFPYLMTATISYVLAMQWRLPRPPIALLSILYLILVARLMPEQQTVLTFQIIMAILTPLYAIPVLASLLSYPSLQLTKIDSAGHIVKESLNLVMPAVLTSALVVVVNLLIFSGMSDLSLLSLMNVDYANSPTLFGVTFSVLNSLLWFVGVHGYYALLPLVELLQEASNLNYSTVLAGGEGVYPMNLSFMGAFVFIGGSGATLSLVIALLMFTKQKSLKLIALASIPIGLLNINEILLFGLPIIFNPRLLVPFLLAPMANVLVSMTAVSLGWVASPSVSVPFNSPIFFNALVATNGDVSALLLQAFNIIIGILIYYPAVKAIGQAYDKQAIHLTALDTSFSRRQEEAQTLSCDPIVELAKKEREDRAIVREMELLSRRDFCLEYQPQVSPTDNKVVGCEALVRAVNDKGNKLLPYQFLPWLEKAGLMKELDLWVVKQAVRDIDAMQAQGIFINVSINITPATLLDEENLTKLVAMIRPHAKFVDIEITEETLLADIQRLTLAFNRLHQLGIKLHIDDFGTGYSSLSYLNQFDIDCIKIDRSFVLALESEKGRRVFKTLLTIADQLEMDVIVEGVETEQQLAYIPRSSSVAVQGWYYAKAMSVEDLVDYSRRFSS